MGFDSGSMSFRRFLAVGDAPAIPDEAILDKITEHALRESSDATPPDVEWGFSAGRHVLDVDFGFEANVFNDAIHFGLRIDTNKVPGELKKAWKFQEEKAAAANNPSGFISKRQKRDAKDVVERRIDEELRSGRFRRSKLANLLWDLPSGTLFGPASVSTFEKLAELFDRAFKIDLQPMGAGTIALRHCENANNRRGYDDLMPTRFVTGPAGDQQQAEYPWTAKGDASKDFLGNEFLVWLWHATEKAGGLIDRSEGAISVMFDRVLELDCAFGQTGRDALRGDGPAKMPEAIDALRVGKVPRKAGMILDQRGQTFGFNFNAESFAVSTLKIPDLEADTPRTLFEERITALRDFTQILDKLYGEFLDARTTGAWENHVAAIRKWILTTPRPMTAVA
jgi:hypothetical protein